MRTLQPDLDDIDAAFNFCLRAKVRGETPLQVWAAMGLRSPIPCPGWRYTQAHMQVALSQGNQRVRDLVTTGFIVDHSRALMEASRVLGFASEPLTALEVLILNKVVAHPRTESDFAFLGLSTPEAKEARQHLLDAALLRKNVEVNFCSVFDPTHRGRLEAGRLAQGSRLLTAKDPS